MKEEQEPDERQWCVLETTSWPGGQLGVEDSMGSGEQWKDVEDVEGARLRERFGSLMR